MIPDLTHITPIKDQRDQDRADSAKFYCTLLAVLALMAGVAVLVVAGAMKIIERWL